MQSRYIDPTILRFLKISVGRFQRWGPTIAGLSLLPLLPYMFDHPAEHLIDKGFANFWPSKYGDERHHHHHNKEKEQ